MHKIGMAHNVFSVFSSFFMNPMVASNDFNCLERAQVDAKPKTL